MFWTKNLQIISAEGSFFTLKRSRNGTMEAVSREIQNGVEFLLFPELEKTGIVKHLFSTRVGGVSKGDYCSMNFSFTRGDEPDAVLENFKRIGCLFGSVPEKIVATRQTHTTNILRVNTCDGGKGITKETDYSDIDGLVTDEPGLILAAFFADCVPLYFVDPIHRAIGLAHSGWRGTVGRMGEKMVQRMHAEFNTCPRDLIVAIGPSICQDCYEVGEEVAQYFSETDRDDSCIIRDLVKSGRYGSIDRMSDDDNPRIVLPGKVPGKYQLDLWLANAVLLIKSGILPENLIVTDICTCHNSEYLFSHRVMGERRGNLGAFLMLN